MKATGIVRRMDDLGRVVIPKEIRKSMRIREGDALEIFTGNDGTICFRKYSPIGQLDTDLIKKICDVGLGELNYTVYDIDGYAVVPTWTHTSQCLDLFKPLDENTTPIDCDGECIGYLQTPSGNRELVAEMVGNLMKD